MNATNNRSRNCYVANCCVCGAFVEQQQGWLYQDTQSRQSHRDIGFKKHWKVKCDDCHSGISKVKEEKIKRLSVTEAKNILKKNSDRFDVAVWNNEKVTTFDGKPLDNFVITSYLWVSPEQFIFLTTGVEMSDIDMTSKAYALLESFCLELDDKRQAL